MEIRNRVGNYHSLRLVSTTLKLDTNPLATRNKSIFRFYKFKTTEIWKENFDNRYFFQKCLILKFFIPDFNFVVSILSLEMVWFSFFWFCSRTCLGFWEVVWMGWRRSLLFLPWFSFVSDTFFPERVLMCSNFYELSVSFVTGRSGKFSQNSVVVGN